MPRLMVVAIPLYFFVPFPINEGSENDANSKNASTAVKKIVKPRITPDFALLIIASVSPIGKNRPLTYYIPNYYNK